MYLLVTYLLYWFHSFFVSRKQQWMFLHAPTFDAYILTFNKPQHACSTWKPPEVHEGLRPNLIPLFSNIFEYS